MLKKKTKEKLIAEIRSEETKAKKNHARIMELAKEALPRLRMLELILTHIIVANHRLNNANDHVEAGIRSLQESYGETIEVEKPGIGLICQLSSAGIGDYIVRLEGMLELSLMIENKALVSSNG